MNTQTLKEKAEVINAVSNGKEFEWENKNGEWTSPGTEESVIWYAASFNIRIKPEPSVPREWWLNVYPNRKPVIHKTKHSAEDNANSDRIDCVHVREVIID